MFTPKPLEKNLTEVVTDHYNKFPYPNHEVIRNIPQQPHYRTNRLNYDLRRRKKNLLPENLKIWIPGAGTDLALKLGLSFPEAEILATDISKVALDMAQEKAQVLNLKNITFKCEDLTYTHYKSEFDLIYCTGVVHHLAEPLRGLKILNEALVANGAAVLMVYNKQHRSGAQAFQKSIQILTENSSDPEVKFSMALRVAENILKNRPGPTLKIFLKALFDENKSVMADQLMHPQECSYSIEQLYSIIAEAGFRFSGWLDEDSWQVSSCINDEYLLEKINQVSDFEKYALVYHLKGEFSPMFRFYVEKNEMEQCLSYSKEEFLSLKMESLKSHESIEFSKNLLTSRKSTKAFEFKENKLVTNSPLFPYRPMEIEMSAEFEKIFIAADGGVTVRELLAQFKCLGSEETLLKFFEKMLSKNLELLTPNYF